MARLVVEVPKGVREVFRVARPVVEVPKVGGEAFQVAQLVVEVRKGAVDVSPGWAVSAFPECERDG